MASSSQDWRFERQLLIDGNGGTAPNNQRDSDSSRSRLPTLADMRRLQGGAPFDQVINVPGYYATAGPASYAHQYFRNYGLRDEVPNVTRFGPQPPLSDSFLITQPEAQIASVPTFSSRGQERLYSEFMVGYGGVSGLEGYQAAPSSELMIYGNGANHNLQYPFTYYPNELSAFHPLYAESQLQSASQNPSAPAEQQNEEYWWLSVDQQLLRYYQARVSRARARNVQRHCGTVLVISP
ncbi:MAG: hypothetical protein LQ340_003076 [Diploschistes diacapsis]|nr:MAG: hypothetical protein LQ340_003076 [Diploschistes diacapsis]